jgi:hypothetical protein
LTADPFVCSSGDEGYVPFENLIGRAERIVFSIDEAFHVRFDRIGIAVR